MGQTSSRIRVALGLVIVSAAILAVVLWGEGNGAQAPPARPAGSESAAPRGGKTRGAALPDSVTTAPASRPAASPPNGGPEPDRSVAGLSVRVITGQSMPVVAAIVACDRQREPSTTDANGQAMLLLEGSGACQLQVSCPGYATEFVDGITAVRGAVQSVTVTLMPAPSLEVHVVEPDGRAIPAAVVAVAPFPFFLLAQADGRRSRQVRTAVTDQHGVAQFAGMPLGTEFIDVTASGFVARGQSVRVSGEGPTQSCTVTMSPADALVVRVIDEQSREPVKGALVTPILGARGGIDTWKVPLTTGESGEVRFSVAASTACSLLIDGGERYERYEQPDLPTGTHVFEAALHPTWLLTCRVEGASGELVTDCSVEYQRERIFERERLHRDDGVFPVRWQSRPRPARFRFVHPVLGSSDWDAIRRAPSGGEPIPVKLTPPALIRGLARFVPPLAGGRAIAELWSTSEIQPRILTGPRAQQEDAGLVDADGSFELHARSGGAYLLRVVAPEYGAASRLIQIQGAKPGNEPSMAPPVDAVRGALGSRVDVGTLTLNAGAELSVTALHGRAPAPYAEVWILPDESTSPFGVARSLRADAAGVAVFRDVAAGNYRVAVAEPGLDSLPPIGAISQPGPLIEVHGGETYRVTASY